MNKFVEAFMEIFITSVALSSMIFMLAVFVVEVFGPFLGIGGYFFINGQKVSYLAFIEPNVWIASGELIAVVTAFVFTLYFFMLRIRRLK